MSSLIIFLMGPTASGKTALALEIAKQYSCEIVSVDSASVYRGMDIGTAKPSPSLLSQIPYHLISIKDPTESYSVGEFREDALKLIQQISKRGKVPLLVGGTMLYFHALKYGLNPLPKANAAIRKQLELQLETHGVAYLHKQLQQIDEISAQKIHPQDQQRIKRALEVYYLTEKSLSAWHAEKKESLSDYAVLSFALIPKNRWDLYPSIEKRLQDMLSQGLVDEVKCLYERGDLHKDLPAIRAVGYKQVWQYFSRECSYEEMVQEILSATKRLVKRQLTWLKADLTAIQLTVPSDDNLGDVVLAKLLERNNG